jgi:bifunctional non-homologous end joining protein LigD
LIYIKVIYGRGDIVYRQACKLGCEGIVSKRLGTLYRSGRSKQWVKGRFMIRGRARVVQRHPKGDW